ncbi:hypothetical protein MH171_000120 [Vibrio parahaemolyticus]|uniref:hypothetical protein n=1 Tax=Vibrio parahaemolyticus TaxID=670 RepID=UPI00186A36CB|nr:hypothetical protein [Vibrio parahaemolyticus]EIW7860227.1 hypothetical protein [Vibrio parahaemolyticus]ELA7254687.1 hypothetical protein [Vibrio parahaemolyticus]EMF1837904.1 hypothetical protein [Vibrio parahaemolyticus]MBE4323192.1 hypothetical protein [Vibrio parahaemolyticus]MBE4341350.1 hypothetical protein [Vibrio parahaemolyticus]
MKIQSLILCVSIFVSTSVVADVASLPSISNIVAELRSDYVKAIEHEEYVLAVNLATELNAIDPSDTEFLLMLVLAHKKSGEKIPEWLFKHPWPNVSVKDKLNQIIANELQHSN